MVRSGRITQRSTATTYRTVADRSERGINRGMEECVRDRVHDDDDVMPIGF